MTHHYTRSTVEASAWCPKCKKKTMHRVDADKQQGRLGPCLDCIANLESAHESQPVGTGFFEAFRPKREISDAAQRALDAGIPVQVRKGVQFIYVNEATADYLEHPPESYLVPQQCTCAQRPYPHDISVHTLVRREKPGTYFVWDGKFETQVEFAESEMRWPWSLRLSPREEPSTERKQG